MLARSVNVMWSGISIEECEKTIISCTTRELYVVCKRHQESELKLIAACAVCACKLSQPDIYQQTSSHKKERYKSNNLQQKRRGECREKSFIEKILQNFVVQLEHLFSVRSRAGARRYNGGYMDVLVSPFSSSEFGQFLPLPAAATTSELNSFFFYFVYSYPKLYRNLALGFVLLELDTCCLCVASLDHIEKCVQLEQVERDCVKRRKKKVRNLVDAKKPSGNLDILPFGLCCRMMHRKFMVGNPKYSIKFMVDRVHRKCEHYRQIFFFMVNSTQWMWFDRLNRCAFYL